VALSLTGWHWLWLALHWLSQMDNHIILLLFLVGFLLFYRKRREPNYPAMGQRVKVHHHVHRKPVTAANVVGMILSILVTVFAGFSSYVSLRVNRTLDTVTTPPLVTSTVGVYVLTDDPAQSITDVLDDTFAITSAYDASNTQKAIRGIELQYGAALQTRDYEDVFTAVNALYGGDADAMLLNVAYASILNSDEEYADFDERVRLLYTYEITADYAQTDLTGSENAPSVDEADGTIAPIIVEATVDPVEDLTVDPFVVYLSGSDTRNKMLTTSRSDVNILAVVNPSTREVLLINTPRDYYVQISIGHGAYDKLTHCGIYGIGCSIDTLEALYGVEVNYYAQINFTGFEMLIDQIGGVTVYSEKAFSAGGYSFQQGNNYLNGAQALSFARERHAFASGDNQRGKNQMKIITAVIQKLTSSPSVLQNYSGILNSLEGMFVTDVSSGEISEMVKLQFTEGGDWNIHSFAVTGAGGKAKTYSMPSRFVYVMYQDAELVNQGAELIDRVLAGETLTDKDLSVG